MTRRKKIIISSTILIVIVVAVLVFRDRGDEAEYETEIAQAKNIQQTVSVTGELVSEEEISLNFETAGRIKSIKAYVGKEVAQGDIIATIDDAEYGQQLIQAEAALEKALAVAGANDDTVREAEQTVDDTKDYLDMTEELEDQKVDAADQSYEDATDYYDAVETHYNQEVSDHGENSPEEKFARISLKAALGSKHAAEEAKSTTRKTKELNIRLAKNSRNLAEEKLESAESDYLERSNNSAVESSRAAYNIALMNLDKTSLKAPANGIITQLAHKSGEVLGSASFDLASSASTSFARMISSDFIIESQVPESDIIKVKIGQTATVTFDALDESETFVAKIVEVDPASTVIQDVVYYEVKVRLSDLDIRLKAGMSADMDIHTAEKKNVIAIPQRAIKEKNGEKTVELMDDQGQISAVKVKIGLRGDNGLVEITSGLKGGENVVTFTLNGKKK